MIELCNLTKLFSGKIALNDVNLFIQEGETLKAKRNEVSAKIGQMKKAQQDTSDAIAEMNEVKDRIQAIDEELKVVQERVDALLLTVPNIPHSSVPVGATPLDNKEIFSWGKKLSVDFELKPHWDLAEKLGIIESFLFIEYLDFIQKLFSLWFI